jgi:tryptophanyl-tRNA synthetase
MANVVSGARATKGGLHLGHFLGCFQKIIQKTKDVKNYIFVLNDSYMQDQESLTEILLDLYSIKSAFNLEEVHIVLENQLICWCNSYYNFLLDMTTFQKLFVTVPKDNKGMFTQSVGDFLFPVKQALSYFVFDADFTFLNDDNIRFVTFTSKLGKKINNSVSRKVKLPQLVTGRIPRLLGYDYRKMSKGNNNAIYISEKTVDLKRKIYRLCDNAKLFTAYPEEKNRFSEMHTYTYPDHFLPFQYLKAFTNVSSTELEQFKSPHMRNELRTLLTDVFVELLNEIQSHREHINKTTIINKFIDDSLLTKKLIDPYFRGENHRRIDESVN